MPQCRMNHIFHNTPYARSRIGCYLGPQPNKCTITWLWPCCGAVIRAVGVLSGCFLLHRTSGRLMRLCKLVRLYHDRLRLGGADPVPLTVYPVSRQQSMRGNLDPTRLLLANTFLQIDNPKLSARVRPHVSQALFRVARYPELQRPATTRHHIDVMHVTDWFGPLECGRQVLVGLHKSAGGQLGPAQLVKLGL